MEKLSLQIAGSVGVFLVIFGTGYWLHRSGSPYSGLLLNVHKLIALAMMVFLAVIVVRANQAVPLGATTILIAVLAALLAVATIITGGLTSIETMPLVLRTVHRILPYLTVLASAFTVYRVFIA